MNVNRLPVYIALIIAGMIGLAQFGAEGQEAAKAQPAAAPARNSYLHGPPDKELIYVALPGTLEGTPDSNGNGIVVLDARDNYNFVKRIPTWNIPASKN